MIEYLVGQLARISTTLLDENGQPVDPSSATLVVSKPDGSSASYTGIQLSHDGQGHFHVDFVVDLPEIWRWRWDTTGTIGVDEGIFSAKSDTLFPVTDRRDLRVLIPACRRAIDGPQATSSAAVSATLDDAEIVAIIADATASLILYTHGSEAFGYQLEVVARDPYYQAPVAWRTDQERVPAADAAILSQAALDHYFWLVKMVKVSETMKNEAVSWEYNLSANVVRAWMDYLIANRDMAIEALQSMNIVLDSYISLVAERDRLAAAWLEPWVTEIGAPVPYAGGGGSGPLEYDYRFNTWG